MKRVAFTRYLICPTGNHIDLLFISVRYYFIYYFILFILSYVLSWIIISLRYYHLGSFREYKYVVDCTLYHMPIVHVYRDWTWYVHVCSSL